MPRPYGTKSLDILTIEKIVQLRKTKSISEISNELGIPKTTIVRYLKLYM